MTVKYTRKYIGSIGVDSGQIFITDPAYLRTWQHGEYSPPEKPDNSYARVTDFMLDHGFGEVERGVSCATDGDGMYDVYVIMEGDAIIKIEIILDEEVNEQYNVEDNEQE